MVGYFYSVNIFLCPFILMTNHRSILRISAKKSKSSKSQISVWFMESVRLFNHRPLPSICLQENFDSSSGITNEAWTTNSRIAQRSLTTLSPSSSTSIMSVATWLYSTRYCFIFISDFLILTLLVVWVSLKIPYIWIIWHYQSCQSLYSWPNKSFGTIELLGKNDLFVSLFSMWNYFTTSYYPSKMTALPKSLTSWALHFLHLGCVTFICHDQFIL